MNSVTNYVSCFLIIVLIFLDAKVTAQEGPGIVIAHPGQDVELLCNVTESSDSQTTGWLVNNEGPYTMTMLRNGILTGYTATLDNNLIVENIMMNDVRNDSEYRCVVIPAQGTQADIIVESNSTFLYVADTTQTIPSTVIAHPGQDVDLMCTVTSSENQSVSWLINDMGPYEVTALLNGTLTGYSSNGSNLIVQNVTMNDVRNGSNYNCVINITIAILRQSYPTTLYVPGVPAMVPDVTVDNNTININGNNVTLTLSWGEPFNNFFPIVNYTVSCSGDGTCPPDYTTTDNTTRSYTITNLTTMTNYTFSVVATNSFGRGEAGVVMTFPPNNIIKGPSNVTFLPGVTPLPIELTCNVTGVTIWNVNDTDYTLTELTNGTLPGHNRTGTNILVNSPVNNTEYICVSTTNDGDVSSNPAYVVIFAGVPAVVPNVTVKVDDNTININGNNISVTLMLSWGEPCNNLDPIVNYIVSCSGDDRCPNVTTTNDTTRNYIITQYLTTMTNYTFSVVATNAIGSGKAGVVNYTTPAIGQANASLKCQPEDVDNQCVIRWELSSPENVTDYQICYYLSLTEMNVTCKNVTSPAMNHSFVAPTLSMFSDAVVVMVTLFNQLGQGPASDPRNATIYASSVTDALIFVSLDLIVTTNSSIMNYSTFSVRIMSINATVNLSVDNTSDPMIRIINNRTTTLVNIVENVETNTTFFNRNITANMYNITVISTIHPESEADRVEVTANNNTGTAQINDTRITTVTIDNLACITPYIIKAGGLFNNQMLAGPRLNLGNTTNQLCTSIIYELNKGSDNTAAIIGAAVGGALLGGAGITCIVLLVVWARKRKSTKQNPLSIKERIARNDFSVTLEEIVKSDEAKKLKPTETYLSRLVNEVKEYAIKWREIGLEFKFTNSELDKIHGDYPNDVKECCWAMLKFWLQKDAEASWGKLHIAIQKTAENRKDVDNEKSTNNESLKDEQSTSASPTQIQPKVDTKDQQYAVVDKKTGKKKQKPDISYMDPSNLELTEKPHNRILLETDHGVQYADVAEPL